MEAGKKMFDMHSTSKQTGIFKNPKLKGKGVADQRAKDLKDRTDQPLFGAMNQDYNPFKAHLS